MSADGSDLDPSTIDLDAWIDGVERPEVVVELYQDDVRYQAEVARIEALIPAAEKTKPDDRGLDDPSLEQLLAQLHELAAERSAGALRVRIRQVLDTELAEAVVRAKRAKTKPKDIPLWGLAAACVEPAFTPEQLARLRDRDRSGEAMVEQLFTAANGLLRGVPVPSSPAR